MKAKTQMTNTQELLTVIADIFVNKRLRKTLNHLASKADQVTGLGLCFGDMVTVLALGKWVRF